MRRFINPLLLWVAHSDHADLIRQIQYLKVENEVLRARLPKKINTTRQRRHDLCTGLGERQRDFGADFGLGAPEPARLMMTTLRGENPMLSLDLAEHRPERKRRRVLSTAFIANREAGDDCNRLGSDHACALRYTVPIRQGAVQGPHLRPGRRR